MFVQLGEDWFVNLAQVVEVSFVDGKARILSWDTKDDDGGKPILLRWWLAEEEVPLLRAALLALSRPITSTAAE